MYLSNRDLQWAIECGRLIVDPKPREFGETSIDLHLDGADKARVWDIDRYNRDEAIGGRPNFELRTSQIRYREFSDKYHRPVPTDPVASVFRRGGQVVFKPGGFLLWQTRERVGTPEVNPDYICFVDGKSTRARTGLLVHLTAPTIHADWSGNITLEIANLGLFHLVLVEFEDVIAQLTVSTITSTPHEIMKRSQTRGQNNPGGGNEAATA